VTAILPLKLEILDARGQPAEYSGYYGLKDGKLAIRLTLASNDELGLWTIRATELASGLSAVHKMNVRAGKPAKRP